MGMWTRPITVVELSAFLRNAAKVWDDDERAEFIDYIAQNPEAGAIIQGTGGIRKVRWSRQGSGKRGGVRVIYFYYNMETPLFLLTLYAKAERGDLLPDEKEIFTKFVSELKNNLGH